jgi:hypothetical protein
MSKLDEVAYDIEQLFIEGASPGQIAKDLGISLTMVYDWIEANGCDADPDPWTEIEDPHLVDISPYATINS